VAELPITFDVRQVGLEPPMVTATALLHQHHGHSLYQLTCAQRSFILKRFAGPQQAAEVRGYALLASMGVPTLPVYGQAPDALLLEDLTTSQAWRLANEEDVDRADVGAAVAEWYQLLHAAGQRLLANPCAVPSFLHREVDTLDGPTILHIGERVGLAAAPVWRVAAEHIDLLAQAIRTLPTTLTHDDFHWSNLALSREATTPLRAIVFDYHVLGIGPAYTDYRNVSGVLGPHAREAFQATYGEVDERAAVLDGPISVLYALQVAVQRPRIPGWAHDLIRQAADGELEAKLWRASAII
jgi:hypothetical protein